MNCLLILPTHTIHSYTTETLKNIGEQKIGEEHSAKNVPAKNMTRRNFRNPLVIQVHGCSDFFQNIRSILNCFVCDF